MAKGNRGGKRAVGQTATKAIQIIEEIMNKNS